MLKKTLLPLIFCLAFITIATGTSSAKTPQLSDILQVKDQYTKEK
jgi:hypothetical protein